MLLKLNQIIIFSLIAFFLAIALYPIYIKILTKLKAWKNLRENDVTGQESKIFNELHKHKAWTPNMGGWLFLLIMLIMIGISLGLEYKWTTNYSLLTRKETYIILFGFFSMGLLWFLDDVMNMLWFSKVKWLSAKTKLIWMFILAWFISRRFYVKVWSHSINLRPITWEVNLWLLYPIFTFIFTVVIVNAINITDGLDGLAWWTMVIILMVFGIIAFFMWTYLTTAIIWIIMAILLAFLRFNINPAKIFMWDSWAYALWWFLSSLIYLLNINFWIVLPFLLIFLIFIINLWSSGLQIFRKKVFHKKLFPVAPLHHLFEHQWVKETNIVMKARLIQWVLAAVTLILMFYQINS